MLTTLLLSFSLAMPASISYIGLRQVESGHQLELSSSAGLRILSRQLAILDWHVLSDQTHILVDQFPNDAVIQLHDGATKGLTQLESGNVVQLLNVDSKGHFYLARALSYRKVQLFQVNIDGVATSLGYVLAADTSKPRQPDMVYEDAGPDAIMPYTDVWFQVMHVVPPLRRLLRPELLYPLEDSPPPYVRFPSMIHGKSSDSISVSPPMGFRYLRSTGEVFRILPGRRPERVHRIKPLTWLVHFEAREGLLSLT